MDGAVYTGPGHESSDSAAAFDPLLGVVVVFGGCDPGACPSNETWLYSGGTWTRVTSGVAPPAMMGESLAWDPMMKSVLLVGGVGATGSVERGTWAFGSLGWTNLSGSVGGVATAYAAMSYEDGIEQMVLIDGCKVANCTQVWSQEWTLPAVGSWFAVSAGPPGSGPDTIPLWNASMAFDRAANEMIYFGGESLDLGGETINSTFALNDSGWSNITNTSYTLTGHAHVYPQDRAAAAMTWEGQSQELVLFGGFSSSSGTVLNDTWYFEGGLWIRSSPTGSIVGPPPDFGGAMPSNSSDIAPLLYGGSSLYGASCAAGCGNGSWVLEIPPHPAVIVLRPNPADVGAVANVSAQNAVGTGSGPGWLWQLYDSFGNYDEGFETGLNFTGTLRFSTNFSYFGKGTWSVTAEVTDFFGVSGYSPNDANLTVDANLSLAPKAMPNPTESGATVTFASGATLGTGAYSYRWGFGDGPTIARTASPAHTYSAVTRTVFDAWVNASDTGGGWNNTSVPVTVFPSLAGSLSGNVTATDVEVPVLFTASATGGSGTFESYAFQFGDGGLATGGSPSQTYTYVRPGTVAINVTVTDSLGFTKRSTTTLLVNAALSATARPSILNPVPGERVAFTGGETGGTFPFRYNWTFGDGSYGSGASPLHSYDASGTYTVVLRVTDHLNQSSVKSITVSVTTKTRSIWDEFVQDGGLYLLGGAAAFAVAGVSGWFVYRARKRPPPSTRPDHVVHHGPTGPPPRSR
jgi:PKD domain